MVEAPPTQDGRSVVAMEPTPGSAFVGTTFFECSTPNPVSQCGSAGSSSGGQALTDARVFLRVAANVAAIESNVPGTRVARSPSGFVLLAIPRRAINEQGIRYVTLTYRDREGAMLARDRVRLPLLAP